ncbi:GNAT family N-acetyltransferase [Salipiger sp.]|uniref:GNAT family N-acetyltransferase n=1 Tax=Salipiger sp. TaxID=2078585 RepID=UPI003A96A176
MSPAELAALAARAYRHTQPWSEAEFAATLSHPTALLTCAEGAFVLGRVIVDEAEILALASDPDGQRQGRARKVLATFEQDARARGAVSVFLEVAAENAPARGLYAACGYGETGRRKGYYRLADGSCDDALLMTKALTLR